MMDCKDATFEEVCKAKMSRVVLLSLISIYWGWKMLLRIYMLQNPVRL